MAQAELLQAREVVLPDVLFRGMDTLASTYEAVSTLCNLNSKITYKPERYMVVPQGQNIEEFTQCAVNLYTLIREAKTVSSRFKDVGLTIGVSKDYEIFEGGLYKIVKELLYPLHLEDQSVQFHLLGWGRDLWALSRIAKEFPWIRSVDSAKPFVYATKEIQVTKDYVYPSYPTRPRDYFTTTFTPSQRSAADWNVNTFTEIARG